jgi:hypothetical protein
LVAEVLGTDFCLFVVSFILIIISTLKLGYKANSEFWRKLIHKEWLLWGTFQESLCNSNHVYNNVNEMGSDFIAAGLHGEVYQLHKQLSDLNFNYQNERLLFLIMRSPELLFDASECALYS